MGCLNVSEGFDRRLAISIVSHGQGTLVEQLLSQLQHCGCIAEIFVVCNIPEPDIICPDEIKDRTNFIYNKSPQGFAANHNQVFRTASQPYFVVLNPDIILSNGDPFPNLLFCIEHNGCALVVPKVFNLNGGLEDSIRYFPTPYGLLLKLFGINDGSYDDFGEEPKEIEWAAGMFMLFHSEAFHKVGGFDERFFLYYEDVDICVRLWKAGLRVVACPSVEVVHDARRTSRRNAKYMSWHLSSLVRYMFKHLGRLPRNVG